MTNKSTFIVFMLFLSMGITAVALISNPLQRGLMGYYYDNPDWKGTPILTIRERSIDLYRKGVEFPSITTHYSIQWKGTIRIPISGEYHFSTIADDHAEIFINNQLVTFDGITDINEEFFKPSSDFRRDDNIGLGEQGASEGPHVADRGVLDRSCLNCHGNGPALTPGTLCR